MHCAVEPGHCFKLRQIEVCHVPVQSFAILKSKIISVLKSNIINNENIECKKKPMLIKFCSVQRQK